VSTKHFLLVPRFVGTSRCRPWFRGAVRDSAVQTVT